MIPQIPQLADISSVIKELMNMDKQTLMMLGYSFYLYCVMDGSNHSGRARARRRR